MTISDNNGVFQRLLKIRGASVSTVIDTRVTPAISFLAGNLGVGSLSINDNGTILFEAKFKDANDVDQYGLFTGPDLVNDKVIATGDSLFGATVRNAIFWRVGFNNQSQVAFLATVGGASGPFTSLIVRADPASGGTFVEWVAGSDGSFGDASNWKPANGDPPRVPEKTDRVSDTALFASCANNLVNLGTEKADRLFLSCGNVIFRGGEFTAASLEDIPPSVELNDASLTLDNSILKSSHAWIGTTRSSAVTLTAAQWTNQGRIEVSRDGDGTLSIGTGSLVHSAEARIGNGTGHGKATVNGGGSVWTTGNIAIGAGGTGELTIESGGQVNSDGAFIGQQPGLGNKVIVQGVAGAGPSAWHVAALEVGGAGTGQLAVKDGALVDALTLRIARQPGVTGSVKVSGVGANSAPSEISTGYLNVGDAGVGELTIEGGGLVEAGQADIGETSGIGTVTVSGSNAAGDARSTLTVSDLADPTLSFFNVGGHSAGTLVIEGGGLVETPGLTLVFSELRTTPSEIQIAGADAELDTGGLKVGGNGNTGAFVTLLGGTVKAQAGVFVGLNGVVRGFGYLLGNDVEVGDGGYVEPDSLVQEVPLPPLSPQNAPGHTGGLRKAEGRTGLGKEGGSSSTNTLTILGNYKQAAKGRLVIPIYGTNSNDYGQLIVSKAATLDGALELRFVNGFAPKQGDTFNFLQVGGAVSNGFATVEVKNLTPDFRFNVNTNGTNISLVALNDGVFVTPLQGQIQSSNVMTVGGISYLPYTLAVTNPCVIVEPTGGVTRQGQELFQTLSERPDPNCAGVSTNASHVLPLGGLPPGSYQFHFMADGVVVHTVSFDVPAGTGQVLSFTRTAGGELNLRIHGLDSAQYTIQASADLRDWFDLPAHVGTFLGPYNILEPLSAAKARFYRVKIE
ncbi:MAG: hypothetical protein DME24_17015 [Verrucomicrobia bacterium]|nr:MAG: hypothetical protein DME24_17015 [Verrucomicrobiota bacterium]